MSLNINLSPYPNKQEENKAKAWKKVSQSSHGDWRKQAAAPVWIEEEKFQEKLRRVFMERLWNFVLSFSD